MLVLTVVAGERLVIAGNVQVQVLGTEGKRVRIGVEAPKSVEIQRQEVWERIHGRALPTP